MTTVDHRCVKANDHATAAGHSLRSPLTGGVRGTGEPDRRPVHAGRTSVPSSVVAGAYRVGALDRSLCPGSRRTNGTTRQSRRTHYRPPSFGTPQQVWEDGSRPYQAQEPVADQRRGRASGAVRHTLEYPEYLAAVVFAAGGGVNALLAPQRFSTAVLFCLAVTSAGLGVSGRSAVAHSTTGTVLAGAALLLALALGLLLLADGVLLVRRYGPQAALLATGAAGCAVLAVLGLNAVFHTVGGEAFGALVVTVNATAGYLILLFLVFAGYVFVRGRNTPLPETNHVVVLGAGLNGDRPGPLLTRRLERALAIDAARTPDRPRVVFVVSGGQGDDEVRSEADAMADYLAGRGVPADRIVREDRSVNTGQNLRFSAALVNGITPRHRATVVTSGFHVYRTTLLARRVGVPVHVVGAPTSPAYWLAATLREFAAILWLDRLSLIGLSLLLAVPVATAIFEH